MRFGILGAVEAVGADGAPVELGAAQHRALLARLLLSPNRVVPGDSLLDALWEDSDQANIRSLRVYVSRLRKCLGDGAELITRAPGYVLQLDDDDLDSARFERLVRDGRRMLADGEVGSAAAALREALDLWRGPALADVRDREFARAAAVRLEEARLGAVEDRVEAELACGEHGPLAAELRGLTADHPERERLWCQRMLAEHRSGQGAQALRTFQELRARLADELGLEPSADARRLERQLLEQDPALEWRPPAGSVVTATPVGGAEAAEAPTRVLLVDDHPLWRTAVAGMLERHPSVVVVAEAEDGPTAIDAAAEHRPDVVLMDLHLPGFTGAEAAARLAGLSPDTKVVMLSASGDEADVLDAVRAGAVGYVLKSGSADEILDAVSRAARGEPSFTASLAGLVLEHLRRDDDAAEGLALTTRQRDVLRLVADGSALHDVGVRLGIDDDAVRHEVTVIVERLQGYERAGHVGRLLRTVLFVDIVGSTNVAARLGDRAWAALLGRFHATVTDVATAHDGRVVKQIGDGSLVTFEQPGRALACARDVVLSSRELDLDVRVGLHMGECEVSSDDVLGMAVVVAARVQEQAASGEVLVSHTVRDLVMGSDDRFEARGVHSLKGVPGKWRLFALEPSTSTPPSRA